MNRQNSITSILNFRDVGGITVPGGRRIREGIIFRSATPDRMSKRDIELLKILGIRKIIDLRAPYENRRKKPLPPEFELVSLPLDFERKTRERMEPLFFRKNSEKAIEDVSLNLYLEILDASPGILARILEILLEDDSGSVLIHCRAGKDRTGILSALVQLVLGADRDTIIREYVRSNEELLPFFRKMLLLRAIPYLGFFPYRRILNVISVKEKNIINVLERIENHYGGVESYLSSEGFGSEKIALLRQRLITG